MFHNVSNNNLERGMRLRFRVLASPFSGNRFDLGVQQPPALAVNNSQYQVSASHSFESPVARQQGEGMGNANAFSLPSRNLSKEFERISTATRPKSVALVSNERVGTTVSNVKTLEAASGSNNNPNRLTSEERLTIFQRLLEDSPDLIQNYMDQTRKTEDEQLSQSKSKEQNSFAYSLPYPPNMDRRLHTKVTRDETSSLGKSNEKRSFVYSGSETDFRHRENYPGKF